MKVHVMTQGAVLPTDRPTYVIGSNGMHLALTNSWVEAVVPVKELRALDPVVPSIKLKLPPLSRKVMHEALVFFRSVYDLHRTEAAVLLHYSAKNGWKLTVPEQRVTYSHVSYTMDERIEGYQCVGTMHSHGNMDAWHSHVDVEDEAVFDGIHITVGQISRLPQFTLSAEVVVRGARFPLPVSHLGGIQKCENEEEKDILAFLADLLPQGSVTRDDRGGNVLCSLNKEEGDRNYVTPNEWLSKVKVVRRYGDRAGVATKVVPSPAPLPFTVPSQNGAAEKKEGEGQ